MPQDGYSQSVGMTATPITDASSSADGLCLDGKRLFPRLVSNVGTVFDVEFKDFTSIGLSPDGQTFTVATKSGETRFYGSTAQSRVPFPMQDQSGNSSTTQAVVALWALDKVMDAWGNYYTIAYNGGFYDLATYGLVATEIDYTGNSAVSLANGDGMSPFNTIKFTYNHRSQPRSGRFGNSTLPLTSLLATIEVGGLGTYFLNYSEALETPNLMDPDKLRAIALTPPGDPQQCASPIAIIEPEDPNCVRPLRFAWDSFNPRSGTWWEPSPGYAPPAEFGGPGVQFVDLDGDGRVDLVHAKTDGGTTNGVWRNNGHGWDSMSAWALPSKVYLADANGVPLETFFMDIDGDGLPDLLANTNSATQNRENVAPVWVVYLNRLDTSKYPGQGGWVSPSGNLSKLASVPMDAPIESQNIGDINGDGRPDLVHLDWWPESVENEYATKMASSDGTQWNFTKTTIVLPDWPEGLVLADMNRDGLADLVSASCDLLGNCLVPDEKKVYFNTGFKGSPPTFLPFQEESLSGVDGKYLVGMGDIDGDGLYDQVFVKTQSTGSGNTQWLLPIQGGTSVYLVTGTGAVAAPSQYAAALNAYTWGLSTGWNPLTQNVQFGRIELVDLNADGLADVVVNHSWGERHCSTAI